MAAARGHGMVEKRGHGLWLTHLLMIGGVLDHLLSDLARLRRFDGHAAGNRLAANAALARRTFLGQLQRALFSGVNVPVSTMLINTGHGGRDRSWQNCHFVTVGLCHCLFRFPGRTLLLLDDLPDIDAAGRSADRATYEVVAGFGMLNSYSGLIFPLIASATATFLFRQFFMTVPDELAEAARVDGAQDRCGSFVDIVVPMAARILRRLFVILFIYGWNQYLWPLLITTDPEMNTIVMGIKQMFPSGDDVAEWPVIMATSILAMITACDCCRLDAEALCARTCR